MHQTTYIEKFNNETEWDKRVCLVDLFHTRMCAQYKGWTLEKTARYFKKSKSFVSENLKIAKALHNGLVANSRIDALRKLSNGKRR